MLQAWPWQLRVRPLAAIAAALLAVLAAMSPAAATEAGRSLTVSKRVHGLAMHGAPALPDGFAHFPYVNPEAPKGGRLTLGTLGSFDSLNPFIVKGVTPAGLRGYVYESLMERSADEPFSLYGLIAAGVEIAADRSAVTFHLRPEARFSDGEPVTSADVLFSREVLADKGPPYMRSYYRKVVRSEALGAHAVRFTFGSGQDRELALIMGLMPILPAHKLTHETFERTTLKPPVGSGPYLVADLEPGRRLVYRRNPDYWGRGLAVNRGRFNFDEIRFAYFRDSSALFEAFKTGHVDMRSEEDPARWAERYDFPAIRHGRITRAEIALGIPAGMTGLAMNTRRAPFSDARVRRAMILMLDADWINRNLFNGLYQRTESFFARSELAAAGRAAVAREQQLLAAFPDAVNPQAMAGQTLPVAADAHRSERERLRQAHRLLVEAGYRQQGRRLVDAKTGVPLEFEFLAANRAQERIMLAYADTLTRMGIVTRIRQVDDAQYWSRLKTFDFDIIQRNWPASLSPGNEQINRWSSEAADTTASLNYPGVKSAAVDAMIAALLAAERREGFVAAARALDRVLMSGDYVIPLFHPRSQWVAYWKHIARPTSTPLSGVDLDTWWRVPGN